ncbi:hypothetical protein LOTGIDRAFT_149761 [Lottia gigantea]|uniref:Uncharacterized protein n=1 Tax=Lottia gigantea TaxID=225164 RepID=V4AZI5_LOTGI|nr:hypothetical protein LOTGIDRAFT_149761 [Lottia gigantea]ESP00546.1 hypothetical protein LOTGIDRAFT_149761 [Lottia gigantea]
MFDGVTAWFSSSVDDNTVTDWKSEKGEVKDLDEAQFIFSNESEARDTKSLYKSNAYLNEHLAIFHSQYIVDCLQNGDTRNIVLGRYFLPPLPLQHFMKKQMKFDWKDKKDKKEINNKSNMAKKNTEKASGTNSSPSKHYQTTNKTQTPVSTRTRSTVPSLHKQTEYSNIRHIDDLPKVKGKLIDFVPGQNGCEVFMKNS